MEECLASPDVLVPLLELYQSNVRQLAELSEVVSEPLTDIQRRILIALITIDVHNRYIGPGPPCLVSAWQLASAAVQTYAQCSLDHLICNLKQDLVDAHLTLPALPLEVARSVVTEQGTMSM